MLPFHSYTHLPHHISKSKPAIYKKANVSQTSRVPFRNAKLVQFSGARQQGITQKQCESMSKGIGIYLKELSMVKS